MQFTISVKESVLPQLGRLGERLSAESLQAAAGRAVREKIRSHLILINGQRPNKLGGRRTNWYAKIARSGVLFRAAADGAVITVTTKGFRYQLQGGTIRPSGRLSAITGKPITRLTIPVDPEAHGKVPSDFRSGSLFLLKSKEHNRAWLVRKKGRSKDAPLQFLYVLKTSVSKEPDPTVMPSPDEMHNAIREALDKYFSM